MNKNRNFHGRFKRRGQGLVEYAIILALVALVSIVILAFIGMAANGQLGIICGVFGCKRGVENSTVLVFDTSYDPQAPVCAYWISHDTTTFYVTFYSSIDKQFLTAKNSKGDLLTVEDSVAGELGSGSYSGPGTAPSVTRYKVSWSLSGDQRQQCPLAVVVQSDPSHENQTIMTPVTQTTWP